jgi:hypothetical protein
MEESSRDILLHDWVIEEIQSQYSKEFNEIKVNKFQSKINPLGEIYPDIIFGNHGQVVMIGEVEVDSTINDESILRWKLSMTQGVNVILFVPKERLKLVRGICWDNKLIEKIKVSSFSVDIPIK